MLSHSVYRIHGLACWILIGLGAARGLGTLVDVFVPTFFAPSDPQVLAEMRATPVAIGTYLGGDRMTTWLGHLGWSFSTALGMAFIGTVQLLLRRSNPLLLAATPIVPLATVMSLAWAVIAATCWFWVPLLGFVLGTLGFAWTWYALRGAQAPGRGPAADVRLLWIGALAPGIAGAVHGLGVVTDLFTDGLFTPAAPDLRRAMEQTEFLLPAMFGTSTSTWQAYLGMNLAHPLTVVGFALTAWLLARDLPGVVAGDRALKAVFAAASLVFFVLALAFWFYAPLVCTVIAVACHLAFLWRQPRVLPTLLTTRAS
jgi:hypothetical protein